MLTGIIGGPLIPEDSSSTLHCMLASVPFYLQLGVY